MQNPPYIKQKYFYLGLALILIILWLLPCETDAQSKLYKITANDIVLMGAQSISGAADGVNQNLSHWRWGKGKKFWDVKTSWKNKYKNFDGGDKSAAFPGSKTWLVSLTDGFHLTRTIDRTATLFSIGIAAGDLKQYPKKDRPKVILKKILLSAISNRLIFNIIYKKEQ